MGLVAWQATVQNEVGNIVVSPIITVRDMDDIIVNIFDEVGSPKSNPFIGTLEGFAQFWASPGRYKIEGASGANLTDDWFVTLVDLQPQSTSNAIQYAVPSFGDHALNVDMNLSGNPYDVVNKYTHVSQAYRPAMYAVPRFGQSASVDINKSGVIVAGVGNYGNPASSFPSNEYVAAEQSVEIRSKDGHVTGRDVDQLFLRRSGSVYTALTGGHSPVALVSADLASGSAVVSRDGVASPVKWRTAAISTGNVVHLLLVMGQSLAQGHSDAGVTERIPAWRDFSHERAWQFKAGDNTQRGPRPFQLLPLAVNKDVVIASTQLQSLEPLRGASHAYYEQQGQTCLETAAQSLLGQHLHHKDHVLGAIVGTGSTAIVDFSPGSEHYQSAQAVITAAYAQATLMNSTLRVWLIWNQGEEDNDLGTVQATYEAAWIAIRDGLSAHTVSAGGAFSGSLIQQCLLRTGGVTGMATLAHAHLIATGQAMGITPKPMNPGYSGSTHLLPLTYLPLGCATGYEIARAIAAGSMVSPVMVSAGNAHLTTSTQIDCTITGGSGSYVFDTTTMPNDAGGFYGVRVFDSGGEKTVTSVTFTSATNLRVTISSATSLANSPRIEFGLTGTASQVGSGAARVNIRDDSAWPCSATGQVVSGWMIHHKTDITA